MSRVQRDNGWEHSATDDPVCPYCLVEQSDFYEISADSDENYQCGSCGRHFSYEREVSVTYSTYPIIGPQRLDEFWQKQDAENFPLESE